MLADLIIILSTQAKPTLATIFGNKVEWPIHRKHEERRQEEALDEPRRPVTLHPDRDKARNSR